MPPTAVGLNTAFGIAEETTYGTVVAPDRWYEILDEGLERDQNVVQSSGLRSGTRNLRRGARRALTHRWAGGDVSMEVLTKGMGRWFKHMLGGTPSVVQQGATTAYLHTYQLGSLSGKSLTAQKQLRDETNTLVQQFTYEGCKVTDWEFTISVGEILQLSVTLDCEDVNTTTAAGAASYGTGLPFHFAQGSLSVAGSTVAKVTDASVSGSNNLKTDSFYLGTSGVKGEPFANDWPEVTGSLTAEFESAATFYDRFRQDTGAQLILLFTGAVISGAYNELLRITVPEVHFTGGTPTVDGPDVIAVDVPWEAAYDGTNPGVTIEYQTTDTAV